MAEILTFMSSSAKDKSGCWRQGFGTLKKRKAIYMELKKEVSGKQMFAGLCRDSVTQSRLWSLGSAVCPPSLNPFSLQRSLVTGLFWEQKILVTDLYPTLCYPMDCSPPGSPVCGILQARRLERVAIPFSRGSFWPRDWTLVSCITSRLFTIWATGDLYLNSLGS